MTNANQYHNIYVPLADVIDLSGPGVLKEFEPKAEDEKNLIVLHEGMKKELTRLKNRGSVAARDFLREMQQSTDKISWNESKPDDYVIHNISSKLDVAFLKGEIRNEAEFKGLEDRIKKTWSATDLDEKNPYTKPIFITTKDEDVIDLKHQKIISQKPDFLIVDSDVVKKGVVTATSSKFIQRIFSDPNNTMSLDEAIDLIRPQGDVLYPNQFIRIRGGGEEQYAKVACDLIKSPSGKIIGYENARVELFGKKEYGKEIKIGERRRTPDILGITPQDMEQYIAFQHMFYNQDVEVVFLTGYAGSGKTLLSYAAAIDHVLQYDKEVAKLRGSGLDKYGKERRSFFDKALLIKPDDFVGGRNPGWLPGDLFKKLKDHFKPFLHAHEETVLDETMRFDDLFAHPKRGNDYFEKPREEGVSRAKINGEAYLPSKNEALVPIHIGHIRGASMKHLIVVDEPSNLTPYEMKTLMERAAPGSRIFISGDPKQVDNPRCTTDINGLTHAVKHYLPSPISAVLHLTRNYRSAAAEHARTWNVYQDSHQ